MSQHGRRQLVCYIVSQAQSRHARVAEQWKVTIRDGAMPDTEVGSSAPVILMLEASPGRQPGSMDAPASRATAVG